MRLTLVLLLICTLTTGCDSFYPFGDTSAPADTLSVGEWESLNYPGQDIRTIERDGPYLYVAGGRDGLFRLNLYSPSAEWEHLGLADTTGIRQGAVTDIDTKGSTLLVSKVTAFPDPSLLRSADGGRTWEASDQGLRDRTCSGTVDYLFAVERSPHDASRVLATRGVVFGSVDGARTWSYSGTDGYLPLDLCEGGLGGALFWHPHRPEEVWEVSMGNNFGVGIRRSTDGGFTWTPIRLGQLFGADIAFGTAASGVVYVSANGSIRAFLNGEEAWSSADAQESVGSIATPPDQPDVLYALGAEHLLRSTDGGRNLELLMHLPVLTEPDRWRRLLYDAALGSVFVSSSDRIARYKVTSTD